MLVTGTSLRPQGKRKEYNGKIFQDDVNIFSTERRGSNSVEVKNGWKLFCCGVELTMFVDPGVRKLVSPQL